ncbi:MAG: LysR family transcriptional regulator [Pseudomonadota bacterium]
MDKWAELRTAYQVAKLGTVSGAAQSLGLHRATVNRHIDVLEQEIGARIFLRHARGYSLTELGEETLRVAQKTEELFNDLAGRARGLNARAEGEIKLSVLPLFSGLVMGAISRFRADNPGCRVVIMASEDLAKLEYGEAHIALRAGPEPDHPDYVVQLFRRFSLNLYAHDRYIARKGMPLGKADLRRHEFVGPPTANPRTPFAAWFAEHVHPSQIAIATTDMDVARDSVFSGLGLGFLSDMDVDCRTDVHPVLPHDQAIPVSIWMVTHVDLHRIQKLQLMLACLKTAATGNGAEKWIKAFVHPDG